MSFSKFIYVKFKGSGKLSKMEFTNPIELDNEDIIQFVKENFPKGEVVSVFVVEK